MYHLFFVCIWLKNSIFGEFSNIYLLSAQYRVKWRHKIRPIAKHFRPILIFFARDDAKLMPGEVCQVSCRYSNKWRSYSRKTEGGSDPTPPGGGGLRAQTHPPVADYINEVRQWPDLPPQSKFLRQGSGKHELHEPFFLKESADSCYRHIYLASYEALPALPVGIWKKCL